MDLRDLIIEFIDDRIYIHSIDAWKPPVIKNSSIRKRILINDFISPIKIFVNYTATQIVLVRAINLIIFQFNYCNRIGDVQLN